MDVLDYLNQMQKRAATDPAFRKELLETRKDEKPFSAFCKKCRELGYEIYEMELIAAGEEQHAAMKRSTNGGGENSPMIPFGDDYYEMFFTVLEQQEKQDK